MFSGAVEMLLHIAYREAVSRRHTTLTLEHLLYVLTHDLEGERILAACGADLPRLRRELDAFLQSSVEQYPRGLEKEPEQTRAFRRVLQTAVLHVQSAGKPEVNAGDIVAAMLQQTNSYACQLLEAQDVTRLDVLNFISHGISKVPASAGGPEERHRDRAVEGEGREPGSAGRDVLGAYTVNLTERARAETERARGDAAAAFQHYELALELAQRQTSPRHRALVRFRSVRQGRQRFGRAIGEPLDQLGRGGSAQADIDGVGIQRTADRHDAVHAAGLLRGEVERHQRTQAMPNQGDLADAHLIQESRQQGSLIFQRIRERVVGRIAIPKEIQRVCPVGGRRHLHGRDPISP